MTSQPRLREHAYRLVSEWLHKGAQTSPGETGANNALLECLSILRELKSRFLTSEPTPSPSKEAFTLEFDRPKGKESGPSAIQLENALREIQSVVQEIKRLNEQPVEALS